MRRILPGIDLGQMQLAKLGMAHTQPLAGHRRVFAAQQEVHLETGASQHQAVVSTDGAGTDDADARASGFAHGNAPQQ